MESIQLLVRSRLSMIEALDDSTSELEKLRGLGAAQADEVISRAVQTFLRRSTPDERIALASEPDELTLPPGVLPFRPRS
jgi:hypothetical protein